MEIKIKIIIISNSCSTGEQLGHRMMRAVSVIVWHPLMTEAPPPVEEFGVARLFNCWNYIMYQYTPTQGLSYCAVLTMTTSAN